MQFKIKGTRGLKKAIKRNPRVVRRELQDFFVDAMRIYNTGIIRNPWQVGGRGGGAPVDTRRLVDSHRREISTWQARIFPDKSVRYATYVHEGTWKMEARPWMDYVFKDKMSQIKMREKELLNNIVRDLGK